MSPGVEAAIDAALVAIADPDGAIRGTGFVVDRAGSVLTCHHVVDGMPSVTLRSAQGCSVELTVKDAIMTPDLDLVLLRPNEESLGLYPLPLATSLPPGARYWTKGFHMIGGSIRAAFPVQGRIAGTTAVAYRTELT